jgi:branched-chain amino acid transport system substrate-binding protein
MARIDLQNAEGGVNGRKLVIATGDAQSTPTGSLAAAQLLVQQKHIFGLIDSFDVFLYGSYRYLNSQNVPVTGTGLDGPEWGDPTLQNMFDAFGSANNKTAFTTAGLFFKSQGCTSVSTVSNGQSPSSVAISKLAGDSAKSQGLKNSLNDTSVPLGSTDLTAQALNIKRVQANCTLGSFDPDQAFALSSALQQNNIHLRAFLSNSGYGSVPAASSKAAQGMDFVVYGIAPNEMRSAATTHMLAALHKYTSFTGTLNIPTICGWEAADLMIKGLELAGKNLTRDGYEKALHRVRNYSANGLNAGPVNLAQHLQGTYLGQPTSGNCVYVAKYVGTTYQVLNNDRPYCGNAIKTS